MKDRRVFISSVINGYTEQRATAKAAITSLDLDPVMAEDYASLPYSSQTACLEGIRTSDLVVAIVGGRYGHVAKSGKSPSEEEYDFARDQGIPVLAFLENNVEYEPAQQKFAQRISDYEDGNHREKFSTLIELSNLVVRSLNLQINRGPSLDIGAASAVFNELKLYARPDRSRSPWLRVALLPIRRQEFISPVLLGKKDFKRNIQKDAVYGDDAIFSSEYGVTTQDNLESCVFNQADVRGPMLSLELRTDGILVFNKLVLPNGPSDTYSMLKSVLIDQGEFKLALQNFFRFAGKIYGSLKDDHLLTKFFFSGSLSGIDYKVFGHAPAVPVNRMTMGTSSLVDPLPIPPQPYVLSRAKLIDGELPATEITEVVARMFRTAGAYYTP